MSENSKALDANGSGKPTGLPNKRRRLTPNADGGHTEDASWDLSPPAPREGFNSHVPSAQKHHLPGSIVRVTMKSFVTYNLATFYPGPALNMIIGPNGTGKSTLVCAICLGLGWGPQHLGRAKEPSEFVKHGASEASIEIELKAVPGRANDIIGRKIRRDNGKSVWTLNGVATNLRRVQETTSRFNIQVDNLCQFLPQDRVVEFANLRPEELLTSTLRAAGDAKMLDDHERLKKMRIEQRQLEVQLLNSKVLLEGLEKRQQIQAADVERIQERQEVIRLIKFLSESRIFAEFQELKSKTDRLGVDKETFAQQLKVLRKDAEPITHRIRQKSTYKDCLKAVIDAKRTGLERALIRMSCYDEKRELLGNRIEDCNMKRDAARKHAASRRSEVKKFERTLVHLRSMAESAPPTFDAADFNERIREKKRGITEINGRVASLGVDDKRMEMRDRRTKIADLEREIVNLNSLAGQQGRKLQSVSRDTYQAWLWIQKNQDQFQGRIYGPPIVECTATNSRFVNQVEAVLQRTDFCAITCTSKEDMDKLRKQLFTTMQLADVSIRVSRKTLAEIPPPIDPGEMKRLGIDGWVLDYISGPEPILSMLCAEQRIHATGVLSRDVSDSEFDALQESQVSNFVSTNQVYTVKRRRDLGMNSTATKRILPAKYWTAQAVDINAEHGFKLQISELKSEIDELERSAEASKQKAADLKVQREDLNNELEKLQDEKNQAQKARLDYDMLPGKIETALKDIRQCHQDQTKSLLEASDMDVLKADLQIKRGQIAIDVTSLLRWLRVTYAQLMKSSISLVEAQSDQQTLESQNVMLLRDIEEKQELFETAQADHQRSRLEAKRLQKRLFDLERASSDMVQWWYQLSDDEQKRSVQEIDAEIEAKSAHLDSLKEHSPNIVNDFEERASRILALKEEVAASDTGLQSIQSSIDAVRSEWEPGVDRIISAISAGFSDYFKHMGDSGYVEVHKAGEDGRDFEDWSVGIHVKFRSDESMSILDSHRQSGGERAVTTVSYLMALQTLSKAPFRVVDEINQGMDPKNERKVHSLLVGIASGGHNTASTGSQYFLITPKLLTGLEYSENMKVHCIVSGEHVPSDPEALDLRNVIQARLRSVQAV